jgi:hypothetical protein
MDTYQISPVADPILTKSQIHSTLLREASVRLFVRTSVILAAIAILYLRSPTTFTHPQFWGEDASFYEGAYTNGWLSIFSPMAGYLVAIQYAVAVIANYFSPFLAPAILNYAAVFLTGTVLWLVTSPRADLPSKPLLALAIVIVPMGYEELGTITNIQWVLPLGAIAILFSQVSRSWAVTLLESAYIAVTAVSGPFSIFLTPIYLCRLVTIPKGKERSRMALLTAILGAGAAVQILVIATNPSPADGMVPHTYSWTLWFTLPLWKYSTTFGLDGWKLDGAMGTMVAITLLLAAILLAARGPYRQQKLSMLVFALLIAVAGMHKFRVDLESQWSAQRYFYPGCIFSLWFICCLTKHRPYAQAAAVCVATIELSLLPIIANTPRITDDLQWATWAQHISSGLPVVIPTSPTGWYVRLPQSDSGPLARYAGWLGEDITKKVDIKLACSGEISSVESVLIANAPLESKEYWTLKGAAWDTMSDRPPLAIAVTNFSNKIVGFGLTGFDAPHARPKSEWKSMIRAHGGEGLRAYAITDNRACALKKEKHLPTSIDMISSEIYAGAQKLMPGRTISQSFSPKHRLSGLKLQFVNFGVAPNQYSVKWEATILMSGNVLILGEGDIQASDIRDWGWVDLPISTFPEAIGDKISG